MLCVWHTVGSWNNNDSLTEVVDGVVPGFPHMTESLTRSTLVFVGGEVCGGVVV